MGNSQSQDSDSERGNSTYNYHESVLRDAQQLCNTSLGGYESDDQYLSAEEGEESDRSVTPPRTRPESSSGEDFSDDSASDHDHNVEGDHHTTQATVSESSVNLANDSQTFLSPSNRRLLAVKKSCGQCNVSRFQEHDSIGPELDRSQWGELSASNTSLRTTRQSTQRRQERNSNAINESSLQKTGWSNSPFKPIRSPLNSQNVSQRSATGNITNTKRKADQSTNVGSGDESELSPKRRHTLRVSPTKRRLAMLDDFDSDSDYDDKMTIKKKPRQDALHNTVQQLGASHMTPAGSVHLKRSMKDNEEDIMTDTPDCTKKRKFSLGIKKLNVRGEKRGLELGRSDEESEESPSHSPRVKNFKTHNEVTHSENSYTIEQPSVVIERMQSSAFQPVREGTNDSANTGQKSERVSDVITRTLKMGNDAVRNSLGKVLPIRNSQLRQITSQPSSSTDVTGVSPATQTTKSDTALSKNNFTNLSLQKRGDISLGSPTTSGIVVESTNTSSQIHNKAVTVQDLKSISNSNNNQSISSSPLDTIENNSNSNACANPSPFYNVVLTPPSSSASPCKNSSTHSLKRAADNIECSEVGESYANEIGNGSDEVAMETDESQSGMNSMETHPYTPRQFARAKKSLTTAERFKNFFTEGSLKSNFKTLFSKRKNVRDRESHSSTPLNQTSWSLYSSPSSSLFDLSPLSNQAATVFHSTSSPIDTKQSVSNNKANFSPNLSNVTGASPFSVYPGDNQGPKQSTTSLSQRKSDTTRKSVGRVATRTSPRLRRIKTPGSPSMTNTIDLSAGSPDSSGSQSSSCDVLLLPQTSEFEVLHYYLSQNMEISLTMGDIAEELSSGIVNWTDGALTHNSTECSRKICAKAGALMRAGCNSYIENKDGALEAPDVLTTPAGGRFPRSVKALLHVVSPSTTSGAWLSTYLLEVNANCLRFASERLGLSSLSMPLIGEGELPTQLCAEAFIDAVLIFITENKCSLKTPSSLPSLSTSSISHPGTALSSIRLVTVDANITDQAADTIQARISSVKTSSIDSVVADIRNRYFVKNLDSSLEEVVDISPEITDRTKSGRPRVKRPRL